MTPSASRAHSPFSEAAMRVAPRRVAEGQEAGQPGVERRVVRNDEHHYIDLSDEMGDFDESLFGPSHENRSNPKTCVVQ